jgi:hypothetical protein
MNLEKGKWYKNLGYENNYIGKYLDDYDNNAKIISEYITGEKEYRNKRGTLCFKNAVLIEDLSEIQKYLPLGHSDYKINKIIELW